MERGSAIVKSIKQRELLNFRLPLSRRGVNARGGSTIIGRTVSPTRWTSRFISRPIPPANRRVVIARNGTRMSNAYGATGEGHRAATAAFLSGSKHQPKLRSLKAINDDGGFDLRNPMRANDTLPIPDPRRDRPRPVSQATPVA